MGIFAWDKSILLWIQENIRNTFLTPVFTTITHLGDAGIFWILLSLTLLLFHKTRRAGMAGLLALIFSAILNNLMLKPMVARIRPYEVIEELILLIKKQADYSFPSGHTGASLACAIALFRYIDKRFGICLIILALVIAFSRLYVGVHYPSDVLGGAISGIVCGLLASRLVKMKKI